MSNDKQKTIIRVVKNLQGAVLYRVNGYLRKLKLEPGDNTLGKISKAEGIEFFPEPERASKSDEKSLKIELDKKKEPKLLNKE